MMARSHRAAANLRACTVIVLAIVSAACSAPAVDVARFDLGLAGAGPADPATAVHPGVLQTEVDAPAWLAGTAMFYRLAYADASQVRSYAQSRWVAAPQVLLEQRLRLRLAPSFPAGAGSGAGALAPPDRLLRIELEEFSQVFDSPGQSHALLRASASFVDAREHKVVAQKQFEATRPAATGDAAGAAHAMAEAADAFAQELRRWIDQM
jgi:cholesterol transport system auxiliary component